MNFQQSITNIATSIASEQTALTALLKQEALKIQKFIDMNATVDELLEVNNSVNSSIDVITRLEKILQEKLILIAPYIQI